MTTENPNPPHSLDSLENSLEQTLLAANEKQASNPDQQTIVQQITRSTDGLTETISCRYHLEFSLNQNRHIVHVPFVPALCEIPKVHAFATDDENVRIRVTDRQRYGIRAEIILTGSRPRPTHRTIEFVIHSEPDHQM